MYELRDEFGRLDEAIRADLGAAPPLSALRRAAGRRRRAQRLGVIATGVAATTLIAIVGAMSFQDDPTSPDEVAAQPASSGVRASDSLDCPTNSNNMRESRDDPFPVNAYGLSWGSSADFTDPADAPDLIAALGKSGSSGYILKSDQDIPGEEPKPVVPVYACDGKTQVDVFERQMGCMGSFSFDDDATRAEKSRIIDEYILENCTTNS